MTGSKEQFMDERQTEPKGFSFADLLCNSVPKPMLSGILSDQITLKVEEGGSDPLKALLNIRILSEGLEAARQRIMEHAIRECEKHGKEGYEGFGFRFRIGESGVKYDFSKCGDAVWEMLDAEIQSKATSKKDREKLLKALSKPQTMVNDLTGEIQEVHPPQKLSTTIVKIEKA